MSKQQALSCDKTPATNEKVQLLRNTVLFEHLDDRSLLGLAAILNEGVYPRGAPIFIQDERSENIYFVKKGSVEIVTYKKNLNQNIQVKVFNQGEHFSEFSLLTESPHSTSCFALEETTLYKLPKNPFFNFLFKVPIIAKTICKELAGLNARYTNDDLAMSLFTPPQFHFDLAMKKVFPCEWMEQFEAIPVFLFQNIMIVAIKSPKRKDFQEVFKEKNPHLDIRILGISDDYLKKYSELIYKFYKGKLDSDQANYAAYEGSHNKELTAFEIKSLLLETELFRNLPSKIISQIIPYVKQINLQADEVLYKKNTPAENLYIIRSGSIEYIRELDDEVKIHMGIKGRAQILSQISIIAESTHGLETRSLGTTQVLSVSKGLIDQLLNVPDFSIPLAKELARSVQRQNRRAGARYYEGNIYNRDLIFRGLIPLTIIKAGEILPITLDKKDLTLGTSASSMEKATQLAARYLPDFHIHFVTIRESDLKQAFNYLQRDERKTTISHGHLKTGQALKKNAPTTVEALLQRGESLRASDIHLAPDKGGATLRYRIDGELVEGHQGLSTEEYQQLVNKIKIMANMDIAERRLPQDGTLEIETGDNIHARVSTLPSKHGEKAVLRLIKDDKTFPPLNILAPDKGLISYLNDVIQFRQGLFIVTGPTGSGKTTTLYSLLAQLNNIKKNIVTIEDPVELSFDGITQVEVQEKIGLSYSRVLKSVLRQDPDIILIGEIRDAESAQLAFEAALTGHLVLTTLHTNNSLDIAGRLKELGVRSSIISSVLIGATAQRLIPSLCKHCKTERPIEDFEREEIRAHLGSESIPDQLQYGAGCIECHGSGYLDRVPIYEYWKNTPVMAEAILNEEGLDKLIKKAQEQGLRSLYDFGLLMALNGLTSIEKVRSHLFGTDFGKKT